MSDVQHPLTYEELMDNYEFKIVKKMLLREYPWVKDVKVKEDEINKWTLIFLDITIDPFELGREHGWTVARWVVNGLLYDKEYWSPYLSTFFSNATYDDVKTIHDEMNRSMESVHDSPALPKELRLPGRRKFQTGSFYALPTTITPEDTTQIPQ